MWQFAKDSPLFFALCVFFVSCSGAHVAGEIIDLAKTPEQIQAENERHAAFWRKD